jgi:hypothetical protein
LQNGCSGCGCASGLFLCLGQQTEVKVKLHFEELNFHDASEEEWREKLLQHFHQDQGISADACASLQIEFVEGAVVAAVVASRVNICGCILEQNEGSSSKSFKIL